MKFNINNFIQTSSQSSKIVDFQDLDHIDGVSISAVSAGLYKFKRDELVLFYFSCLLYTSPSPRDLSTSRMPSSA